MAITFLSSVTLGAYKAWGGGAALSAQFAQNVGAIGDTVIVGASTGSGGPAVTGVSDSKGNTYSALTGAPGFFGSVLQAALVTNDQITITFATAPSRLGAELKVFSGLSLTSDVTGSSASGASATPSAGPITPTSAQTLMLGLVGIFGPTADAFTEDTDTAGGGSWAGVRQSTTGGSATSNMIFNFAYKITSSAASQTYNPAITSRTWTATIASLRAAAVGTPISGTDSATASEASPSVLAASSSRSDSAAAAEGATSITALLPSPSDTAFVTETARVDIVSSDSGAALDVSATEPLLLRVDAGSVVEQGTLLTDTSASDSAAGSEAASSLSVALSVGDTATATDVALASVVLVVDLTGLSRSKLSRVSPDDITTFNITATGVFVEYMLRLVPGESSSRTEGTLIETATVASTSSLAVDLTDDELIAAGAVDGLNTIKAFVKDAAGNWST